jgi:hypothetical protein
MAIPPFGASLTCNNTFFQCCPRSISLSCCCCSAQSSPEDSPPLKHRVESKNKREAQPKIVETSDDERTQYVCVHRQTEEERAAAVAIEALKKDEPRKASLKVRCTIL